MPKVLRKTHPATGQLVAEVPCIEPADVPALIARARRAQVAWGQQSPAERGRALRRFAHVLGEEAERVCDIISNETGKPIIEAALHEVLGVANLASYFGKHAKRILKKRRIAASLFYHRKSYVHYAPRGVIGIISPWNFPFTLACGDVLMALCAGNAVVLKPSEHTPLTGLEIKRLAELAGIDPELVQVAIGHGDVGAAVVQGDVDMVHFTGSVPTGRKIAAACGEKLIPCITELGGKDAAIVLEDADIEHAAQTLVFGAFLNAGQVCASVERVYAVGHTYELLVKRMVEITQGLKTGNGSTDDVDVGPMIVGQQLDIVKRHVDDAVSRGAQVRVGGQAVGPYYLPTVLTGVTDDMAVCREETFGPVLPVQAVPDVDTAIARANGTIYGLSAYVFTRNSRRGQAVAERLRAGTTDVNEVVYTHAAAETPWGGVKQSGVGRTHGDDALRELCEARHVSYSPYPVLTDPWVYPYRRALTAPVLTLLRGLFGQRPLLKRLWLLCEGSLGAIKALRQKRED